MDDLISAIGDVDTMEKNISTLKDMLKKDPDNAELQERLDAANKSYTLMNDKMQKLFESSMTKAQGHLDLANSALTATGNRGSRVELVSNRLAKQQTNFKTLSSENEEVDITEVTVNLRSVELAYNASLMATGKIAQTTLLNYL
jgi:flagellar hook-associated protein 3 FlgL